MLELKNIEAYLFWITFFVIADKVVRVGFWAFEKLKPRDITELS